MRNGRNYTELTLRQVLVALLVTSKRSPNLLVVVFLLDFDGNGLGAIDLELVR